MNRASEAPSGASSDRGQALVVVAVMMAALLGIGALAVDLGYLYVTRNELIVLPRPWMISRPLDTGVRKCAEPRMGSHW